MIKNPKFPATTSMFSINYKSLSLETSPTPETSKCLQELLDGAEGADDYKKEQLWLKYVKPLSLEISEIISERLEEKCKQAIKHYESKTFIVKGGLFDSLTSINNSVAGVQASLSLLRYNKHDSPLSYASRMREDFKIVQAYLLYFNNFIQSLLQGKDGIIQINPLRILDSLEEMEVFNSNFDEGFLLLPNELSPTRTSVDLALDEKAYAEVLIPTEADSKKIKEIILEQIQASFERMKSLFTAEIIQKLVNWEEINQQPHEEDPQQSTEDNDEKETLVIKDFPKLIEKISKSSPEDSFLQNAARNLLGLKFKAYIQKLYSKFGSQITAKGLAKVSNLDDHYKKLIFGHSLDRKFFTKSALKTVTEDIVNYFFNERITISPLLDKVGGTSEYFENDLIEFKLMQTDITNTTQFEGFVINFLKSCQGEKYKYISRRFPKRYLCLVTQTKVDFFLFEYDYLWSNEGVKVFISNALLEDALHHALPKVTMAMPAELKHTFSFFNLSFIEPRFNLDYKQVWLNYSASSTVEGSISDLFQLLVYATVYILINHKYERGEKLIHIDTKYLFYFVNDYLDYKECCADPYSNIWQEVFAFGVVPFPFKKYAPKTPKKTNMIDLSEAALQTPKKMKEVRHLPLFDKQVNLNEVRQTELSQILKDLAGTNCLNFDSLKLINAFMETHAALTRTMQIVWPEPSFWQYCKAQIRGSGSSEKFKVCELGAANKLVLVIVPPEAEIPILMVAISQTHKKIIYIVRDAVKTDWKQNQHEPAFRKCISTLFECSFEEFSPFRLIVSFASEPVEVIFTNFYFPKIHWINLLANKNLTELTEDERLTIEDADGLAAYEKFVHLNTCVGHLDLHRAYNLYYRKVLESDYLFFSYTDNWKLDDFADVMEKLYPTLSSGFPNICVAFTFNSIGNNNVYYLFYSKKSREDLKEKLPEEESKKSKASSVPIYQLELFSLNSNKVDDDVEMIKGILNFYSYCHDFDVVVDSFKVNSEANLLMTRKHEETLVTLAFLKENNNFGAFYKAFKLIASCFSHYKEINSMITKINLQTSFEKKTPAVFHDIELDNEQEETKERKLSNRAGTSVKDTLIFDNFIENSNREEETKLSLENKRKKQLCSGNLKYAYYPAIQNYIEGLNKSISKTSTFHYLCRRNTFAELLAEENTESNPDVETVAKKLAVDVQEAIKAEVPAGVLEANLYKLQVFITVPPYDFLESDRLALLIFQPHSTVQFKLFYVSPGGDVPKVSQKIESLFQKLREAFKEKFNLAEDFEYKAYRIKAKKEMQEIVQQSYYFSLLYFVKTIMSSQTNGDDESDLNIVLELPKLLQTLNEEACNIYKAALTEAEVRNKHREILKEFSAPSDFCKKPCSVGFPRDTLKIDDIGTVRNLVQDLKKQFVAKEDLSCFVLGVNLSINQSLKHYMTVWTREKGEKISISIFTGHHSEEEDIVDKLIESYLIEKFEEFDAKLRIKEIRLHQGVFQHKLVESYLDISVYLMAYLTCYKEIPTNEAFYMLTSSSLYFASEFYEFEEKVKSL